MIWGGLCNGPDFFGAKAMIAAQRSIASARSSWHLSSQSGNPTIPNDSAAFGMLYDKALQL